MSEPGWRQTSHEDEHDFIFCHSGGEMIGRIYKDISGLNKGKWRWFFSNSQGVTESRREAMLAVEEAYEKSRG